MIGVARDDDGQCGHHVAPRAVNGRGDRDDRLGHLPSNGRDARSADSGEGPLHQRRVSECDEVVGVGAARERGLALLCGLAGQQHLAERCRDDRHLAADPELDLDGAAP